MRLCSLPGLSAREQNQLKRKLRQAGKGAAKQAKKAKTDQAPSSHIKVRGDAAGITYWLKMHDRMSLLWTEPIVVTFMRPNKICGFRQ